MRLIVTFFLCFCSVAYAIEVKDLKCESKTNPTGITKTHPSFSWTFVGDKTSSEQGGFRIMMATSIEKLKYPDIWDTGPTSNSNTGPYKYLGEPLKSGQKVYWKLVYGVIIEGLNTVSQPGLRWVKLSIQKKHLNLVFLNKRKALCKYF